MYVAKPRFEPKCLLLCSIILCRSNPLTSTHPLLFEVIKQFVETLLMNAWLLPLGEKNALEFKFYKIMLLKIRF